MAVPGGLVSFPEPKVLASNPFSLGSTEGLELGEAWTENHLCIFLLFLCFLFIW